MIVKIRAHSTHARAHCTHNMTAASLALLAVPLLFSSLQVRGKLSVRANLYFPPPSLRLIVHLRWSILLPTHNFSLFSCSVQCSVTVSYQRHHSHTRQRPGGPVRFWWERDLHLYGWWRAPGCMGGERQADSRSCPSANFCRKRFLCGGRRNKHIYHQSLRRSQT